MRKMKITFRRVVNGVTIDVGKSIIIDFIQRGRTGDKGEQGEKGEKGNKGDKGDQGIQGLQGIQGVQGIKGDNGTQGIQGEKGDSGLKGEKGDKGEKGEGLDWSTITPEERLLLKGEKGDKGEQGIQGLKGDKGDKGDKGAQGAQGYTGSSGSTGARGEKGDKGDVGDTGIFDYTTEIPNLTTSNKTVGGAINELNSGKAKTDLSNATLNKSLSLDGYYKAPDGFMIQWGMNYAGRTVYYPTSFREFLSIITTARTSTSELSVHTVWATYAGNSYFNTKGKLTVNGTMSDSGSEYSWVAIGTWK